MSQRFTFHSPLARKPRRFGGGALLGITAFASLSVAFVSCGGDDSSLSCGAGTTQKGSECIALDQGTAGNGGASSGGTSGTGGGHTGEGWEFEGATAVAPASETALLVVWDEAPGASFNVYVAKKEDGFNFSVPQTTAPIGARSVLVTGLDEDTKYFIVVRAVLDGEEDDNTVVVSGTTAKDDEPPRFAGATKAEPAGAAEVKLSWARAKDDLTPPEAIQYVVYFGLDSKSVDLEAPFAVSAPGARSIVVKRLPLPDTEYFFVVRALDAAGNQDSNDIQVSAKSGPDTTPPRFAGCTSAKGKSATTLDVFWDPATDDTARPEELSYNIYASKTPDGHNFSEPGATVTGAVTQGVIAGLSPDTEYYVVCRAADPSGNEDENTSPRLAKTASDDEPPVFAGVAALENVTAEGFDVTWAAATDNDDDEDQIVYRVYIAEASGEQDFDAEPTAVVEEGATSVTIRSLSSNTPYFVVVRAQDTAGNVSDNTEELSTSTLVSLRRDIELPIFSSKCATAGCHTGSQALHGMRLDPGWSYLSTVGVDALSVAGAGSKRVVAGDPGASHLYERIISEDLSIKMPPTGDPVDTDIIRLWIEQGALRN